MMLVELISGVVLLVFSVRERRIAALGLLILCLVWGATFFVQVPLHEEIQAGASPERINRLVATNWIRTVGWTLRGGLIIVWLSKCISWQDAEIESP